MNNFKIRKIVQINNEGKVLELFVGFMKNVFTSMKL